MLRARKTDGPSRAPEARVVSLETAMGTATARAPKLLDRLGLMEFLWLQDSDFPRNEMLICDGKAVKRPVGNL